MITWEELVDFIKSARETADDNVALKAKDLYPMFDTIKGTYQHKGIKCRYEVNGEMKLFKFKPDDVTENGTFIVENWIPTEQSIWEPIDEVHAGTLEDPIPAMAGMTYVYGKYYIEGETLYICKRQGEPDGGTITLHALPSQLIGNYFEVVTQ